MKQLITLVLILALPINCFAGPGAYFGKHDRDTGALILFKVNRNNISGLDFNLTLPGLCIYDDETIAENTFSFGGENFLDLLIDRNLKINTEFEVESDSGHLGILTLNCTFKKIGRRLSKAKCDVNFSSPVRPIIQLDQCSAGQTIKGIKRGAN